MSSCSTSIFFGDKKLGKGFYLVKYGRYQSIEYSPDENYKGDGGYSVIKEHVISYNYGKTHIIVKTSRYKNKTNEIREFWIIDKTIPINLKNYKNQEGFNKLLKVGLTGPLDSIEFYRQMKVKKIDLRFKEK